MQAAAASLRAAMETKPLRRRRPVLAGTGRAVSLAWREGGFELRKKMMRRYLGLERCLGEPDPALRDEVAFARMSHILRAGHADDETLGELKANFLTGCPRSG